MAHPIAARMEKRTMADAVRSAMRVSPSHLMAVDSEIFKGEENALVSFLCQMCEVPIMIGVAQYEFYTALKAAGCFKEAPARERMVSTSSPVMQLYIVHIQDTEGRFGTYSFDLVTFVCNFAAFLMSNSMLRTVEAMQEIPCEIAKAFMFYTESEMCIEFPARAWFLRRFFHPNSSDFACWDGDNSVTSLIRNPQYFDLMYQATQQQQLARNQLAPEFRQALNDALATCPSATAPKELGTSYAIRHLAWSRNPTTIMTFFTLFINRFMQAMPRICTFTSIAEGIDKGRQLFELAYAMLLGWDLGPIEHTAYQLSDDILGLLDSTVEEMRKHLACSDDLSKSDNMFLNRIVAGCDEFGKRWFAELQVRRAVTDSENNRKKLLVHYVGTREELFSTFVAGIYRNQYCVQHRMLQKWLEELPDSMRPDISRVLGGDEQNSAYRTGVNSFFSVLRLPTTADLHKIQGTLSFFERIGRIFPEKMHALTSTDARGPYIVMPRTVTNILRIMMAEDALTSPNYPKTVAAWPLLALFWVSKRVDPDEKVALACGLETPMTNVNIDDVSAATVLNVLAHWLYVPLVNSSQSVQNSDRLGMPGINSPGFESICLLLHRVVAMVFENVDLEAERHPSLSTCLPEMNSIRSFLMLSATHYISEAGLNRLIALTRQHHDDVSFARDLSDVLEAIRTVNGPQPSAAQPPGFVRKRNAGMAELYRSNDHEGDEESQTSASSAASSSARRPRGRPSAASAGRAAIERMGNRISLAVLPTVNESRIMPLLGFDNKFRAASTETGRCLLLNHWIYEFLLSHGDRALMLDFVVSTTLSDVMYQKPMYVCSPDSVRAWEEAVNYTRIHLDDNRMYDRHRHKLRPEFAPTPAGNAESYAPLVMFLRRLEAHVCMIHPKTSAASSSSSYCSASANEEPRQRRGNKPAAVRSMANVPDYTSAREGQLIKCLEKFYQAPTFTHPVPSAACYDPSTGQFEMLPFDSALTMVGLVPWKQGANGVGISAATCPDYDSMFPSSNDASAPNALSSVSVGIAALLTHTLDELRVASQVEPHAVFNVLMARKAQARKANSTSPFLLHSEQNSSAAAAHSSPLSRQGSLALPLR